MSIQQLYFGKDDAETDFTDSGLLREGFLKTDIYGRIKSGTKTLVIGRKGSGKSALCLMLNRQLCNEADSCIITPDAISADEIRRFELIGINEEQSKKLVWRYVFLSQICKFLLKIARTKWDSESKWPSEIRKIRQFLVDNREVDDLSFQEKFWRIINKINATLTFGAFGQALEISAKDAPNLGLQLGSQLDFLENLLVSQIQEFQERKLYILVDKVDEIWGDDSSSALMVNGLLMAAKDINIKFPSVHCVIFLRSDIYEQLLFFDKDKFRGDEEAILWTEFTLPELILVRARISTKNATMTPEQLWSRYFPSRVEQSPTQEFILSHTLMRPRDLIQLCNLCADLARRGNNQSILERHILQALDVYSSWKLNDLIGEYRVNYPFLNDLLILFSNSSFVLHRKRFETIYGRVEKVLKERYPSYESMFTVDSVLNVLYGIGFLGVERNRHTVYYYEIPGTVEDTDSVFVIHPAFRYALKSTSSVDINPYQADSGIRTRREDRYLSEIYRGRSAIRGTLESPRSRSEVRYILERLVRRLDIFRTELSSKTGIPFEIVSEISRNVGAIIREFENVLDPKRADIVELQIVLVRTIQYLSALYEKLQENNYSLSELEYLIRELQETRERFYDRFW